jgi:hypothetical protein
MTRTSTDISTLFTLQYWIYACVLLFYVRISSTVRRKLIRFGIDCKIFLLYYQYNQICIFGSAKELLVHTKPHFCYCFDNMNASKGQEEGTRSTKKRVIEEREPTTLEDSIASAPRSPARRSARSTRSAVAVTQNVSTQPPKKKLQCNASQKGGTKPPETTTARQEGSSVSSSEESSVSSSENTEDIFDFLVDSSTPVFENECQQLHDNERISGRLTDVKGDGHCGIYCVIIFLVQSCGIKNELWHRKKTAVINFRQELVKYSRSKDAKARIPWESFGTYPKELERNRHFMFTKKGVRYFNRKWMQNHSDHMPEIGFLGPLVAAKFKIQVVMYSVQHVNNIQTHYFDGTTEEQHITYSAIAGVKLYPHKKLRLQMVQYNTDHNNTHYILLDRSMEIDVKVDPVPNLVNFTKAS